MNLTKYSKNKMFKTFARWGVPKEFVEPFYNYLVWGFRPGSCFEAILANDFAKAISRSHPSNTIEAYKALVGWIDSTVPKVARGSHKQILIWSSIDEEQRRSILEEHRLIYTSKEEVMLILKDERIVEPHLY
jgi:Txe/YoeB family toxin of Txe-Axe toxin-antitoxin module